MTRDDELTILLTLKDRTPFTFRWMSYHDGIRFPFKVLVADGGSDERVSTVLSDRTTFPNVNYEYVRYPHDTSYAHYYAKVADALSRIETPFVAQADNDDFFVVSGLRRAAEFLADHPDYATCGGQCAIFWVTPSQMPDQAGVLYGPHVEWKCSLDARSLTDETAGARIRNHSRRTTHPTYYHVRRIEDLRRQYEIIRELNPQDLFFIERLILFLTAIAGKTKQLDTLFIARQWNSPDSAASAHMNRDGDWLGRMLVPTWSRDFTNFVNVTSSALAAEDGLTIDEARRSVIESYRSWLVPHMLGDILAEPNVSVRMFLGVRMFQQLLRLPAESLIRRVARTLYRRMGWVSVDAIHGTQWRNRRVRNAEQAFRPIYEFLANTNAEKWPPGSLNSSGKLS